MATIPANTFNLKLCFSTWLCPEWTAAAIVDGMQSYGYDGVEFRLGKGHLHGVELDSPAEYLAEVRKQFDETKRAVACLATSIAFSTPDAAERKKSVENLKQCMRVAEGLGAPYVRVFGGEFPPGCEATGVVDYVAESLGEVADFVEQEKLRAMVLLQTHDSFSHSKYVLEVMEQVYSKKVGVCWDVLYPLLALEKAEDTYDELGSYIRHVHLDDAAFNEDRTKVAACAPGEGLVPMGRVVDLLKSGAYRGYLCAKLEKPDVDPDEVLPKYAGFFKHLIAAPSGV